MAKASGTSARRRGRPRKGESNARQSILQAALHEFSEHGYDATTIRGIATRAGVDPALVHHHFGSKADLLAETMSAPMRPDLKVPEILAGPHEEIGESIARYVLEAWENPNVRKQGLVLLRAAVGNRVASPLLAGFLSRELIERIAAELDVPDAKLRASLVASQIAGLLVTRYILKLPGIGDVAVEDLVPRIGATIQNYLTGELPEPTA